ncbi:MAG: sigma-70 family RNA polymerase sigma factor [Bacteroidales bacterium]|nr:sigma-70 family RNA polymerase sigma factor [Bacteroidales bacterium]
MKQDTEQFKRDYLSLQPAMQRMAESLLHNEEDAADIVQDCFVTLWNEREKLQRVVNREAWCITLVKRRCVDFLRCHHTTVEIDDRTMALAEEEANDAEERLQLAMKLVEKLPDRQRQVIQLKHFDAADTEHIASKLGITPGNVYTLLSRTYNSLKQMILEYEER